MPIVELISLPLAFGAFDVAYHHTDYGDCISVSHGDLSQPIPVVRIHSSCLFGEAFQALDCDCGPQLAFALRLAGQSNGTVIYRYAEGRGIGLENKFRAIKLQQNLGVDTVEAFSRLGHRPDERSYEAEIQAMADLGVAREIRLVTHNPNKQGAVAKAGYTVKQLIPVPVTISKHNQPELLTKRDKLGHSIVAE
jgi:3,4-dihydroxy 2-butanone 4-phosphate synthase/GTP cyclohydrolase II